MQLHTLVSFAFVYLLSPLPSTMDRTSWISFVPAALLALVLFMAGQAKMTSLLTPEGHAAAVSKAPTWHEANPYLIPPAPANLYIIGTVEIVLAVALLVPQLRRYAALASGVLMAGAIYTHVELNEEIVKGTVLLSLSAVTFLLSGEPGALSGKKTQ